MKSLSFNSFVFLSSRVEIIMFLTILLFREMKGSGILGSKVNLVIRDLQLLLKADEWIVLAEGLCTVSPLSN